MVHIISDKFKAFDYAGRDYPILRGDVKLMLKNVHNGKTEVYEKHNAPTNAIPNIFAGNYGGLMNYDSFSSLYNTWLGGVLLFENALDPTAPNDYGIPDRVSNPITAHAGQATITDQGDDLSRGNPDSSQSMPLSSSSTKLVFEWGTSAGIGTISSLGLTHTDVGSYFSGSQSEAMKLISPFANVALGNKSYAYGDNANAVMAIDGNMAYNFYLDNSTKVHLYKTPINNTKFKLQGGSLAPLTAYTSMITITLPASYDIGGKGGCYYYFDFANDKLLLFGIPTEGGTTIYIDEVDLSNWHDQTATHSSYTVSGASFWKFKAKEAGSTTYSRVPLSVPTKAMIKDGNLYVYGTVAVDGNLGHANRLYKINMSTMIIEDDIDITNYSAFTALGFNESSARPLERFAISGGLIVHDSFLINGDKTFQIAQNNSLGLTKMNLFANEGNVSSPCFGMNGDLNSISVCKFFLGSKWNLDSAITKNSSQSMTLTYILTEE